MGSTSSLLPSGTEVQAPHVASVDIQGVFFITVVQAWLFWLPQGIRSTSPGRDSLRCLVIAPPHSLPDTVEIRGWPAMAVWWSKLWFSHLASPHNTCTRGRSVMAFPDGDASLFHLLKNRLMGRWKHPIIAGQGLTPRLHLVFACMGGDGTTMCVCVSCGFVVAIG